MILFLGYSPDGADFICLGCPEGSRANTKGATSVEQCTGKKISLQINTV